MMSRRGFSLVEVMVAASMSLLLMGVIWAGIKVLRTSTLNVNASQEPRKQLRAALGNLQKDLRQAAYLFPAGSYDLDNGDKIEIPAPGSTGDALAFAIPENSVSPILYTVVVVYTKPRGKTDINNPKARTLVYLKATGVDPPTSDLPGEIDLETLPLSGGKKVFDAYLADSDGFVTEITNDYHAVRFAFHLRRQEARGELQQSNYQTTLALRNTI